MGWFLKQSFPVSLTRLQFLMYVIIAKRIFILVESVLIVNLLACWGQLVFLARLDLQEFDTNVEISSIGQRVLPT